MIGCPGRSNHRKQRIAWGLAALLASIAGGAIGCLDSAVLENISENQLNVAAQPDFVAGSQHVASSFWWLSPNDSVPVRLLAWNVTMHDSGGRTGSFDLCGPREQIRLGHGDDSTVPVFAGIPFLLRLLEAPAPDFASGNPVGSDVLFDFPLCGSVVTTFQPTQDARIELQGIIGDSSAIASGIDIAFVPASGTRVMEPRPLVFFECTDIGAGGECVASEWQAQMSLGPINWSPRLTIRQVRVLRGESIAGAPAGTEGRVLDTTFSGMAPIPIHSVRPQGTGGVHECFPEPNGPKTEIDFRRCCRDRDCTSAGENLITPGYLDAAVDSPLTWEIKFRTNSNTPPPDASDTLALEFTLEPR